ncbi:hypothetical protein Asal01_03116 [Fodinibius salicampi]
MYPKKAIDSKSLLKIVNNMDFILKGEGNDTQPPNVTGRQSAYSQSFMELILKICSPQAPLHIPYLRSRDYTLFFLPDPIHFDE